MSVDTDLRVVVCLGNPGEQYEYTRHNAGFMVADILHKRFGGVWKKGPEMLFCNYEGWVLVKPMTFMNNSGEVFDHLPEVEPEKILVVVDEVNLPLGRIRLREGGSAGGHNGLASVEFYLQNRGYCRLRVGVGTGSEIPRGELIDFVLGDFTSEESECLARLLDVSADAVESWVRLGTKITQDEFNRMDVRRTGEDCPDRTSN